MFTVEQRDALREHMLRLAAEDERVVAGAAVGSLAVDGGGDGYSDLDLTFGVVDHVPIAEVLGDWTRNLVEELEAVHLTDVEQGTATYRVFLLPDTLQFDLSLTPAAHFRPRGPRFRLLFGETSGPMEPPKPPTAEELFGWGVIYVLHARACIERGRMWQAEHYIGAVRDRVLALACLRDGLPAVQARGYDDLPAETLARLDAARVRSLEREPLREALVASVSALMTAGKEADLRHVARVAERLAGI